ncbi:hypothetical protein FRUB_03591 [Fimbriiglobus ruber]|uniref:Uncharacterized protein n=1 Tax=Fimbriiglobus ruber TaxID=1908690 RepID=A0A225DRH0_9BACT|nr:hypothetical protein FRUB_03591 [Fimbriiglobus ruber]
MTISQGHKFGGAGSSGRTHTISPHLPGRFIALFALSAVFLGPSMDDGTSVREGARGDRRYGVVARFQRADTARTRWGSLETRHHNRVRRIITLLNLISHSSLRSIAKSRKLLLHEF